MGYINPLLELPAGRALMELPAEDRKRIEIVMRELRSEANEQAETAHRRRKGPMYAYWRAVSTYARHLAHALSQRSPLSKQLEEGSERQHDKADELVPELAGHLSPQPLDDVLQRVDGDLDVCQRLRRSSGLENDVCGRDHLQHDADLVEGLAVDHGLQCTEWGACTR